ncbi:MAG: DegV family protein [Dehalococcoidia bacterium]|tara:strand:+ start:1097 stop:1936 length:840 start_codon:yes stop_codon:yes gene_type:complete
MTLAIVTDSTSNISQAMADELGITIIPLNLTFGEETLLDMQDITPEAFFKRLTTDPNHPTTSQPSVGSFLEVYNKLIENGATEILSIHISKKVSGTNESATQAAAQISNCKIEIIDSATVSLPLGFGVLEAAKALKNGKNLDEIKDITTSALSRSNIFLSIDTLDYLIRGGRMSKAKGFIGSKLNVKPILTVEDGLVGQGGKTRNYKKSIDLMLSKISELAPFAYAGVVHSDAPELAAEAAEALKGIDSNINPLVTPLTPVLGVHAGPGAIGIAAVSAE